MRRPSRPAGPGRPRAPKRGVSFNGASAMADAGLDGAGSMVAIDVDTHALLGGDVDLYAAGRRMPDERWVCVFKIYYLAYCIVNNILHTMTSEENGG